MFIEGLCLYPPAPMLQATDYGYSRKNKTKQLARNEIEGGFKERKILTLVVPPQGIFNCSQGVKYSLMFIEGLCLYPPAPMLQATDYGYSRKNKTKQLARNEMEGGFKERTSKF